MQGRKYLGVEGGMAFEKKFPNIFISIKNLLLALKLIYLVPLYQTIYKLTYETKNEKKLSNHLLSGCPKNIKKNI